MQTNKKLSLLCSTLLCALPLVLGGCLPDSDSVKEKRLIEFSQQEAGSYASSLSSYSMTSQNVLSNNPAWVDGSITAGLLGTSSDESMAYGYCSEGSGDEVNHILFTWLTDEDSSGNFALKGLGKESGAAVVQALAKTQTPETIGVHENSVVRLRGPRGNNDTRLELPAGCNLPIPEGAPVIVAENLSAPDMDVLATAAYEYRTLSCDEDGIGSITERRSVSTDADNNTTIGNWEEYDNTCDGAISMRSFDISKSSSSLIGAIGLGGDSNNIQQTLSGLGDLDCATVTLNQDQTDENGDVIAESGDVITDTCDANGVEVLEYQHLQEADVDDDINNALRYEEALVGCGAGATSFGGSYQGYGGSVSTAGWNGQASYRRYLLAATVSGTTGNMTDYTNTGQWGKWRGYGLSCLRNETLNVACLTAFPQFANGSQYVPILNGGYNYTKQNSVNGWNDPVNFVANQPISNASQGWSFSNVSCQWQEVWTSSACPSGYSVTQTGEMRRTITAISTIGQVTYGGWTQTRSLNCQRTVTEQCAAPTDSGGFANTGATF